MLPTRRDVLAAVVGGSAVALTRASAATTQQVKFSAGTDRPRTAAPAGSTDCHIHIYDARFPAAPNAVLRPPDASVADYREFQRRIGTTRMVVVQPSTYGVDNRCTEMAVAAFGGAARGIAVVNPSVTLDDLKRLDRAGFRGIRFNLAQAGATTPEMIAPLAARIMDLGWHIQVNASASTLTTIMPILERVPVQIVFDHLAHIPQPDGIAHPLFASVRRLLERRRAWVKLSGAYQDTTVGPPSYADVGAVARAYVAAAPDRLVWGSDWPHPTTQAAPPDDAVLFDLLGDWAPDARVRQRILVDNAAELYRFDRPPAS